MLVLTRRRGEAVIIDGHIRVTIEAIHGQKVRIGIRAPRNMPVNREEVQIQLDEQARPESGNAVE